MVFQRVGVTPPVVSTGSIAIRISTLRLRNYHKTTVRQGKSLGGVAPPDID